MKKPRGIRQPVIALVERMEIVRATGVVERSLLGKLAKVAKRLKQKRNRNKKRGLRRDEKLRREDPTRPFEN